MRVLSSDLGNSAHACSYKCHGNVVQLLSFAFNYTDSKLEAYCLQMGPVCLCIILCLKGCSDSSIQVMCQKLKYILPMKLLVAASWLIVSVNYLFFFRRVRAVLFSSVLLDWFLVCFVVFFMFCFGGFFFCFGPFFFFSFRNTITRKSSRYCWQHLHFE